MPVRIDGAEYLYRYTAPGVTNITARFAAYLHTDRNAVGYFWVVSDTTGDNAFGVGVGSDGVTLTVNVTASGTPSTHTGSALTVGRWYDVALVKSGTSFTVYLDGASDITFTDAISFTDAVYVVSQPDYVNCSLAHLRMWQAALSAGEIQAEDVSTTPARTSNLFAAYEFTSSATADTSGNGYTLTAVGSPTITGADPFTVGAISGTLDGPTGTLSSSSTISGAIAVTLDGAGATITGTVAGGGTITGAIVVTLTGIIGSAAGTVSGGVTSASGLTTIRGGSVTIYRPDGSGLASPVAAAYDCEWLIGKVGEAHFTLSRYDAAATQEILRPGNLVLIETEGLPAWGGVIDPPLQWGDGSVTVTAYSAERLLRGRRPAQLGQVLKGTAGAIYAEIIRMAVSQAWLPLEVGTVYAGGTARDETLETDLLTEVERIAGRDNGEWFFEPVLRDGRLLFLAHYYAKGGLGEMTGVGLVEGVDLRASSRPLTEQGEIINDLLGYGDGASWKSRPTYRAVDLESQSLYGVRQGIKGFDGNTSTGTLEENTKQALAKMAHPVKVMDVYVNNHHGKWPHLRRGNWVTVTMHSCGFLGTGNGVEEQYRIAGMGYANAEVRLIGEDEV